MIKIAIDYAEDEIIGHKYIYARLLNACLGGLFYGYNTLIYNIN